ncbi:biotin transport system substrate-specific component [Frondihabitans sp. PhB188]|uniref:biotin transporter BioY n=1 Tax=Frondihabitans sp. PhB188 TaxID=2485200 RepID=UPI000F4859B6|nr:biotin transporter BioY [Frondihabitans sp. PhB188]ROQ40976.1 biotin transport system substrate-specific component [Frondihabitans sp. PhB188]
MTNTAAATTRPVLADRFVSRSLATDAALVLGGVAFTGLLAQIEIPLWPVPITGQTLAVMLVGATLGLRRGALSLALYALIGLIGAPIFAGHAGGVSSLQLPSFGFIIGFIPAAALVGWLSERNWDRHVVRSLAAFLGASLIPFAFGLPYLGFALANLGYPHSVADVLAAGFTPFIVGGLVKWVIAAGSLPLLWRAVRAIDQRRSN